MDTFKILVTLVVFVTVLALAAIFFSDRTFQYCYGQITIVQDQVGCPTPSPDKP